ncbi:cysteine-rich receptor-like protein kinase 10 [Nymphaea colorata]|nr:cysteine-rich receptor-like protein kinase 10 [Nymphaea colorata]XP_049937139.1 cysteine-rich receptor-like protein kinase 10 [Nymphaea colorata]
MGSCRVVYDTELFYDTTTAPSLPPQSSSPPPPNSSPPSNGQRNKERKLMFVIIAISVLIVVLITCMLCVFYWRKREFCCIGRKKMKPSGLQRMEEEEEALQQQAVKRADVMDGLRFDLATIRSATNNFAAANKLGEGGFGAVYRGQLPDGQEVAVKRLSRNTGNGPKQFHNECGHLRNFKIKILSSF